MYHLWLTLLINEMKWNTKFILPKSEIHGFDDIQVVEFLSTKKLSHDIIFEKKSRSPSCVVYLEETLFFRDSLFSKYYSDENSADYRFFSSSHLAKNWILLWFSRLKKASFIRALPTRHESMPPKIQSLKNQCQASHGSQFLEEMLFYSCWFSW